MNDKVNCFALLHYLLFIFILTLFLTQGAPVESLDNRKVFFRQRSLGGEGIKQLPPVGVSLQMILLV